MVQLRDVEELASEETLEEEGKVENEADTEPKSKKRRIEDCIPTARVVGIIKRNWRQYCGVILPALVPG